MKDYFLIAIRNLRKRGVRSWLTILGIFIGIAAVVSLISLGQGLKTALTAQFSSLSTDLLLLTSAETGFGPPGSTAVRKLTKNDLNIVRSVRDVELAIPRLIRITKVEYNSIVDFKFAANMPNNKEQLEFIYKTFKLEASEGRLLKEGDKRKIILGNDFVKYNEFGKKISVGTKLKIQDMEFEVVGIIKRTSSFQINSAIFIMEDDMKNILNIGDEIDLISIKVVNANKVEEVAKEIERKIRKSRGLKLGEEDFSIRTPVQTLEAVNNVLNIINFIVAGIAAISLLVGGIGIANTMFTSVLERTKEIGVMKAIGAKNKDVLYIFIIESALLGLIGGFIGAIIGLSISFGISSITARAFGENILAVHISYPLLLAAIFFSLAIGIISGIIPATQASKLNPVEALRK